MRLTRIFAWLLGTALLTGLGACGTGGTLGPNPAPQPPADLTVFTGGPAFPPELADGVVPVFRRVSADTVLLDGNAAVEAAGNNNYELPALNAYAIVPGGDDDLFAWAMYTLPNMGSARPDSIDLHVTSAPIVPGGDDDLPLSYYVGISDYTEFAWEWHGPYSDTDISLTNLNGDTYRPRLVSEATSFYLTVATSVDLSLAGVGNEQGLTAAQIESISVHTLETTDPAYVPTAPAYTPFQSAAPLSVKSVLALDPDRQYVTLRWQHFVDPFDPPGCAQLYRVYRKGPGDASPILLGGVPAPDEVFVDPVNANQKLPQPVPGATYFYYIKAFNVWNEDWASSGADLVAYTIPLLAPEGLHATDGQYEDKVELTWTKAEGATGYKIYRDGRLEDSLIATVGDVDFYDDYDVQTNVTYTYYLKSVNQFVPQGSQWSPSDTGYAALLIK